MNMNMTGWFAVCAGLCVVAQAAEQVWNENGEDNVWSLSAPNWDAGVPWTDGSTAVFSGTGGVVEVSGAVAAAGMTFLTNGYVIADADGDGALTLAGAPSLFAVVNAGETGTVSEVIGGSGGLTKTGPGVLQLLTNNAYAGVTTVSQGILRMGPRCPNSLGATGAGNGTVIQNGAALDVNGAMPQGFNSAESLSLSGAGPDGGGALINRGGGTLNAGFTSGVTLLGDTTVGCFSRIDIRSTWIGNDYTLTKIGGAELAVGGAVSNCAVVINAGNYTYMHIGALGGSDFDTTLNGGSLRSYGDFTCTERLICNGGGIIASGSGTNVFKIAGRLTFNGRINVSGENANMTVDLAGPMEGAGGFTRTGSGTVVITGDSNTYSGATIVNATLNLGRTNQASGVFGTGPVTNSSTVYIDRSGPFVNRAGFFGGGRVAIRYGAEMIMTDCVSSNANIQVGMGTLTLSNGVDMTVSGNLTFADRQNSIYSSDPSNVVAALNILDGASLTANVISAGNGSGGSMTGIVTQTGGRVRTTGWTGGGASFPEENDGLHLGHYPTAYTVWNMQGGELVVGNGYRLAIAVDGRGVLHQTGGEVFATEVVVNARSGGGGHGRLTLEGGVLNVGSNGVTAGNGAPYLIEYGGGTVRAVTNFASSLNATLTAAGVAATVFDTREWGITLSGNLTGAGGLSKAGTGTLTLSGANSYEGPTRVMQGRLVRAAWNALPAGNEVQFGVTPDDAGGRIHADGDLSLEGLVVGVADPEMLDKGKVYTVATWGGALVAGFDGENLPAPWYVHIDWPNKRAQLRDDIGTVIWLR
jgi:autotransporter-associated beta strand protein